MTCQCDPAPETQSRRSGHRYRVPDRGRAPCSTISAPGACWRLPARGSRLRRAARVPGVATWSGVVLERQASRHGGRPLTVGEERQAALTLDAATLAADTAVVWMIGFDIECGHVQAFGEGEVYRYPPRRGDGVTLESGATGGCYSEPR